MMRRVYRVFESLDALVTVVEEARSFPMTANCVVPRGDVLELLDDVREALPAELDDAQDVLDRRDEIIGTAEQEAARTRAAAQSEADELRAGARTEAEEALAQARHEAERIVAEARRAATSVADAARDEADRLAAAGQAAHERYVADGRSEQARLVSQTEITRAARAEAVRIVEAAEGEANRLRHDCDAYVDGTLAQFEESLDQALRTVSRGRTTLRRGSPNGAVVPAGAGRSGTGMDLID
jgi:cell division septum initiation protein DivIVA